LKNTDPVDADGKDANLRAATRKVNTGNPPETVPSLKSADLGSGTDEQLSEAVDVLRGLAVIAGRAG
jgi:hypothetical protein